MTRARVDTPHGRAVLVELDDAALADAYAALDPSDRAQADALPEVRRRELISGRRALLDALEDALGGPVAIPLPKDDRGAPVTPAGWLGSISHKAGHAVALVAPADATGARVGVDLERTDRTRVDIARRILTPRELAALPTAASERFRAVLLRFSIKEAIYKAIDPFLRRYVGFQEVELAIADDGTAHVTSALGLTIEATWREHASYWLTTARARRS
ncbi:MAG: 4'-phosphopantetheinyl transferase superfamily protein [Deltaproteobacteria bacterium]|nr:4'-phosphopantetheinyl transferase superfamily protein [Deltaproteobacteria bacterium]